MNENFGRPKGPTYDEDKSHHETDYGWTFEGPFYTEVPSPNPEYVGTHLARLQHLRDQLLTTVIIHDQFDKDHWARRNFYTQQGSELIQFGKRYSKLKRGKMVVAVGTLTLLQRDLAQQNPKLHQKIAEIFIPEDHRVALEQYNDMELEQKKKYAKMLDNVVYRCLKVLSE